MTGGETMTSQAVPSLFSNAVPVFMKSFGNLNPDRIFYVIWREKSHSGLFSNVFHVLAHLQYAKDLGLTPVVDMKNFRTLYNEPNPVSGKDNAWEYYFGQPSNHTLDDVYKSKRVVFCYGANNSAFGAYYDFTRTQKLAKQFLYVRDHIEATALDFAQKHFHGETLGVHIRGQEMKTAAGHPVPPSIEQMLERAESLLQRYPISAIFVVSEEQSYVEAFQQRFGDKVVATKAFRTHETNAYTLPEYPRPLHMYHLGRELLVDTLLLSRCDHLLAGGMGGLAFGSGVSMMAQAFNNNSYKHIELVYNGILPGGPGQRAFIEFVRDFFPEGNYRPAGQAAQAKRP